MKKETGKGLSTNDYTTDDQTKLDGDETVSDDEIAALFTTSSEG